MKYGRLPIDELRAVARLELRRNPTITEYRMAGGVEVDRRPVGWAGHLARMEHGVRVMSETLAAELFNNIGPACDAMQAGFDRMRGQLFEAFQRKGSG